MWSSEADGSDAFTPLVLASQWAPSLRLGCAIVPAFTRGPALMAQSIGALAQAAPGRFAFGLGTSSNVIVEKVFAWPGIGSFALEALVASDYAPVQGFVLTMAVMYVLLNLVIDILYGVIDPRVRLEG